MPEPGETAVRAALVYMLGIVICGLLSGCAQEPPVVPVAPVKIQVTSSDFCQIIKRAYGPAGPTWDVSDTPETITGIRRLAASFRSKRCNPSPATS